MAIYTLGSINVDHVYRLGHMPAPGETLAAQSYGRFLGGKGANQSVAAAKAGAKVRHIGAVGADGDWALDQLRSFAVGVSDVAQSEGATGHAIIYVDDDGENQIVIFPGANADQNAAAIAASLADAGPGDSLLIQNETTCQVEAAQIARQQGMRVIYSAAPFDADAVRAVMPFVDLLVMNKGESEQLAETLDCPLEDVSVPAILVTRGGDGAFWRDQKTGEMTEVASFHVNPVDTTGAGDCFIGYVAAALDEGQSVADALRLASAASAIKVTREGAAPGIPLRAEVEAFLKA